MPRGKAVSRRTKATDADTEPITTRYISTLQPWERQQLLRDLATQPVDMPHRELAAQWNVSEDNLKLFKSRNKQEIARIIQELDNEMAGMWIAHKANRIAAYQDEYERLSRVKVRDHFEWSKARQACLRAVAEELGQLPGRSGVVVIPVQHVLVGIDPEDLK